MLHSIPRTHMHVRKENVGAKVLLFSDIDKHFAEKPNFFRTFSLIFKEKNII
jgi:hypothetical protein